jgi:hypothetical protein
MAENALGITEIENQEHISPQKTGDNIAAKRVANYGFGPDSQWSRTPLPLVDIAYDYVGLSNPDANNNYQTIVFKQGGSSGSTVRTLAFTFDGSNNVTSITRT